MISIVCLMLLASSSFVTSHDQIPTPRDNINAMQPKSIFILAGQSNMAGRGGIVGYTHWDGVVPPECRPNPRILRLSANLTWEEARDPLHQDIDVGKACGVGPGMSFSNSVLERYSDIGVIGLVPCAKGGTKISLWGRGGNLYNQLLSRAQAALLGGGGQIRAILWYQGESDTTNEEDVELYKGRLEKFFNDVRSDLNLPELPVIQVALATGEGPYIDVIRRAQFEIDLPNVRCVDAKGLQPLLPDGLHLGTAAQVPLGQMLADAFLKITAPDQPVC